MKYASLLFSTIAFLSSPLYADSVGFLRPVTNLTWGPGGGGRGVFSFPPSGPTRILAMPVGFSDAPPSLDAATARPMIETATRYWNETSYGALSYTIDVAPAYTIPRPKPTTCDYSSWNQEVTQAAVDRMGSSPVIIYEGPCN